MSEYNIGIGINVNKGQLDSVKSDINSLVKSTHTIKVKVDTQSIKAQLRGIRSQFKDVINATNAKNLANDATRGLDRYLDKDAYLARKYASMSRKDVMREVGILNNQRAKEIDSANIRYGKLNYPTDKVKQDIQLLNQSYKDLREYASRGMTSDAFREFENYNTLLQSVNNQMSMLETKQQHVMSPRTSEFFSIKDKISNGSIDAEFSALQSKFENLGVVSAKAKQAMQDVQNSYTNTKNFAGTTNIDGTINSYNNYTSAIQRAKNEISMLTNQEKKLASQQKATVSSQNLEDRKKLFGLKIDDWIKNSKYATTESIQQMQALKAELQSVDNVKLTGLQNQFRIIEAESKLAYTATTETWGDKFKGIMGRIGTYASGAMIYMKVMQGIRSMAQNTLKVDTAMTELRRVTDLSATQYDVLYDRMTNSAKAYGTTLDGIINSTASWVRLGFNENESVKLAEVTAMYQHVTDLDEETATKNLVTAYKGFQAQLLEGNSGDKAKAVQNVADIYDNLGNKFAESAADVGEGLSKSASVLAQAGASIQESAGM